METNSNTTLRLKQGVVTEKHLYFYLYRLYTKLYTSNKMILKVLMNSTPRFCLKKMLNLAFGTRVEKPAA